jgi:hypothetical protein
MNRTTRQNHWLEVRLVGRRANRDGYGALVEVRAGGAVHRVFTGRAASYLSCSDRVVHVGLGGAKRVEGVAVVWPGGARETWGPFPADRRIVLEEGTGRTRKEVQGRTTSNGP